MDENLNPNVKVRASSPHTCNPDTQAIWLKLSNLI
jgi:hypothetical protein